MPFITINGFQVPQEGTLDTESPNYAAAFETIATATLQNKSSAANKEIFMPDNAALYFTDSGITIADGDWKFEQEVATGDFVSFVRRSAAWVEYDRFNEDLVKVTRSFEGKTSDSYTSTVESDDARILTSNTNGQNRVGAAPIIQNVDNLAAGDSSAGIPIIINTQGSVGTSDGTSLFQGAPFVVSGDALGEKIAINVRPGWTFALKINAETAQSPLAGYTYDGVTVVNRSIAFSVPGNDVGIFTSDNDTIIVGFTSPFSIFEANLVTPANQDILSVFQYSTGNDAFSPLSINSDTTNGFSNASGQISFIPPGNWATSNVYKGSSTLNLFYIEIQRTRNGLATTPIESQFKLFQAGGSDMFIHGNGCIEPVTIPDVNAFNNTIYFSADQNTLCWKNKTGTVNTIDITVA